MKKKIALALALQLMAFGAAGCAAGSSDAGSEKTSIKSEAEDMTLSEKNFTADNDHVKRIGRTYLADNGTLWLVQSASGAEFTFKGTKASVNIVGDSNAPTQWGEGNYARLVIYVNGEIAVDEPIKEAKKTYDIFSSDAEKDVTVKVLKVSECCNSTLGIESIDVTSVGNAAPTPDKELKIEFIGDSITCGYGVDDEVKEHHFSTETEDATKAYAVKTAELLDADYSLVSFSGHGIISGYSGDGKKQDKQQVPDFYNKVGRSYGAKCGDVTITDVEWDFTQFVPDVVVINLGTNDDSYVKNNEEKTREYIDGYVEFLGDVRSANPDADIICTLGVMGDNLYPAIETAVSEYTDKTGDKKVTSMKFDVQNQADGYAADWHPTAATHTKAAAKLAEEIKSVIGK